MNPQNRIYNGIGWCYGQLIDGYGLDGKGMHFAGFFEWRWHIINGRFGLYGGPGIMLGYQESYSNVDLGLDFGAQGGIELKLGALVIGTNVRSTYRTRFGENIGNATGIAATGSISIGIAFDP